MGAADSGRSVSKHVEVANERAVASGAGLLATS